MPIYLFESPEGNVKEIIQRMSDDHAYSEDGVEWTRLFTVPNAAIDSVAGDPYSEKEFMRKTNKSMKLGDMWDISQEMSNKRMKKDGKDGIKDKVVKSYEKKTKGKAHPLKDSSVFKTKHFTS